MLSALLRLCCVLAGAVIVSGLYATFVSNLGQSFARASNAFWSMAACAFLVGFVCSVRPPLGKPRSWWPLLVAAAAPGFFVLRSSPEGFLLFGLTPLANSWAPPLLGVASGALVGAELSRGS